MFTFKHDDRYKHIRPELKRPVLPGLVLLAVLVVGTFGYHYIWKDTQATWIDSLYMTMITLSTIGYSETYPLNETGRLFTILISIAGIGSLFYVLSTIMENLFIIQLHNFRGKKKMMKKIEKLSGHYILVGFGRVGQLAAQELKTAGKEFIVIDDDFVETDYLKISNNLMKIYGDATEDSVLQRAGVERASGMIVATGEASTTLFVVLSAKVLNPDIFIVARADEMSTIQKLERAGANRVVNPYSTGGKRLANLMINPNVTDLIETTFGLGEDNLKIETIHLTESMPWVGKTLVQLDFRNAVGASIIAVVRDNKPMHNPGGDFMLQDKDKLVVLGTTKQLKNIEQYL